MEKPYIYENNFSFHTLEFNLEVSNVIFNKIYDYMTKHYGIRRHSRKHNYLYYDWANSPCMGLRIVLSKPYKYVKKGFFNHCLKLIINPRSLINEKNEYFGVFAVIPENIIILKEKLNNVLWNIGLINKNDSDFFISTYGSIDNFKLTRIDYCVNIIFDSADTAKNYLKLLSRGDIYNFSNGNEVLTKMNNRHKKFENELRFEYKSFYLNIYNKLEQLKSQNKEKLIPDNLKGYLRFEICLSKKKIKYLKNKYNYDNLIRFLLNSSREAKKQFKRYISFLFKKGQFMNMKTAKEYIKFCVNEGLINNRQANEMLSFLDLVSEKRSIYLAKQCIDSKVTEKRIFDLFELIKLNPITIPERWNRRNKHYNYLPSPYEIMGFEDDELFKYS